MKSTAMVICLLLCRICLLAQSTNTEFNFGFEKFRDISGLPDKWLHWGSGYQLKIDTVTKHSGRASILITPIGEKGPNSTFGSAGYGIPAIYDAKEVEVQAFMKLDNVTDGTIGLMIRVDGSSGVLGFENMMSKNIQGTSDWASYSVKIPYPKNGKTIFIGAILSGKGKLWVDDFKLLFDGKEISEAKALPTIVYKADSDKEFDKGSLINGIVLSKSKVEDLDVLGKIWGFLKYYHPSIAAGNYNWDYELFRILPKIVAVKNQKDRNSILNSWVQGVGTFEVNETVRDVNGEVKFNPDLSWMDQSVLGPELIASLKKVTSAKRSNEHYYIDKIPDIGNPEFKNERPYDVSMKYRYPDQGFRLLSLYRYWNMIAYFFPYKNLIQENWNKVSSEFIPRFLNAANELEYKLVALALIARIHDTHANIWGMDNVLEQYKGERFTPLEVTFVENKAVVTNYYNKAFGEATGLKIGDIIETVEGKRVDDIINQKLPLTPASNYPTQLRDIASSLLRTNDTILNITYRHGAKEISGSLKTFKPAEIDVYSRFQKKDTCFKKVTDNIAWIYPGSIKNEYLPVIIKEVLNMKGLIIDFRCYPSAFLVFTLGEYLLPEPTSFVKFSSGSIETPGLFTIAQPLKVGKSNPDYFKGKTVIIVNEVTQSSAEYHTMAFRTAPGAKVIGSTTAGADGNVSRLSLPGGINSMISGIGVYYPDGRETQRIGIVPDIEVRPTIKGIQDGRDELLEKAIAIIEDNKK
jgi:hypothetical protein